MLTKNLGIYVGKRSGNAVGLVQPTFAWVGSGIYERASLPVLLDWNITANGSFATELATASTEVWLGIPDEVGSILVGTATSGATQLSTSDEVFNESGPHDVYLKILVVGINNAGPFAISVTDTTAPAAVTSLTPDAGNALIDLTWTAIPTPPEDFDKYQVRWGTSDGGPYPNTYDETNGAATSYQITGLTNDTLYYVVVASLDLTGNENVTSQVSATPTGSVAYITIAENNGCQHAYAANSASDFNLPATPQIDDWYDQVGAVNVSKYTNDRRPDWDSTGLEVDFDGVDEILQQASYASNPKTIIVKVKIATYVNNEMVLGVGSGLRGILQRTGTTKFSLYVGGQNEFTSTYPSAGTYCVLAWRVNAGETLIECFQDSTTVQASVAGSSLSAAELSLMGGYNSGSWASDGSIKAVAVSTDTLTNTQLGNIITDWLAES